MGEKALRFGISDGAELRAATWKLWTQGGSERSELYIACRPLGGMLKASLHASGDWRIAYTKGAYQQKVAPVVPESTSIIARWPRPPELAPGITLAFRIITPFSAVTSLRTDTGVKADSIIWLPNAPNGKATEIDILITSAGVQTTEWPGRRSMSTSLVGALPLKNGEIAWAVYRVVEMPDLSRLGTLPMRFFAGSTRADLDGANLRALLISSEPDGSRVMYDVAGTIARGEPISGPPSTPSATR